VTIVFYLQEYNNWRWENIVDLEKVSAHFCVTTAKIRAVVEHTRCTIPALKKAMSMYQTSAFKKWNKYIVWVSEAELKRINIRELLYFFNSKTSQYKALEKALRDKGKTMIDVFAKVSMDASENIFKVNA